MKTFEKIPCAACGKTHYEEITSTYETELEGGLKLTIADVNLLRCPACGDELIPSESQDKIDRAVEDANDQPSVRELEDIHERFGLDQTEVSEVLGLGTKTFHRWLNGTQFPSRSMGYYLRVLAEFPEAFEWLKERRWRERNRVTQLEPVNISTQFRDLAWLQQSCPGNADEPVDALPRFNPAHLFQTTNVK
jgi:putative zinc finger/helix-turn-helix YgiT family protein